MTGAEHQLLEATSEAAPRRRFQRALKVACLDDAPGVSLQIGVHAPEEDLVAEEPTQNVKDETALLVEVPVEQIEG